MPLWCEMKLFHVHNMGLPRKTSAEKLDWNGKAAEEELGAKRGRSRARSKSS